MSDFFFVLKCMAATLVIIFVMQIRVGSMTLEQKSVAWIHESSAADELRSIAEGAVKVAHQGYDWASDYFPQSTSTVHKKKKIKLDDPYSKDSPRD